MGCSCALSSPALAADPRWAGDISKKLPNRWTFLDYIHYYIPIIVDLYYSVYYTHYPLSWGQRRPFLGTETCRRSFFGIALKYGHVCNKTREGQPLIEIICVQYVTFFFVQVGSLKTFDLLYLGWYLFNGICHHQTYHWGLVWRDHPLHYSPINNSIRSFGSMPACW